jgi:hypothetical protein
METDEEKLWKCNSCELKLWFLQSYKFKKNQKDLDLEISFSTTICSDICDNLAIYFLTKELYKRGISLEYR